MIDLILQFHEFLKDKSIKIANKKLHRAIQNVVFLPISEKLEQSNNEDIFQKFNETSIITINEFSEHDQTTNLYFVIGFKQTLLFIQAENLSYLVQLFESKNGLNFLFLLKAKDSFEKHINREYPKIKYQEIKSFNLIEKICDGIRKYIQVNISYDDTSIFLEEIIWPIIEPCILNNLALECYQKVKSVTRFNGSQINICENKQQVKIFSNDDYIEISEIASGSSCKITLFFLIEKVEIFVIKKAYAPESDELNEREILNYKELCKYNHPFLPKLIGLNSRKELGFGIEFIYGQELSKIKFMNLDINDKFTIIFELLIIFEFIHRKGYIYRDLKPNNIIIDQNKTPVLIDFDQMIKIDSLAKENEITKDFESNFVAPEISCGKVSFKSDVYSFGKIMLYILDDYIKESDTDQTLNEICKKCINENAESRPQISELIIEFYTNFSCQINIKNIFQNNKEYFSQVFDEDTIITMVDFEIEQDEPCIKNDKQISNITESTKKTSFFDFLGIKDVHSIAFGSLYEQIDIDKAIEYYSIAAEKNDIYALNQLGDIYNDEKSGRFDINKAIEYYTKAADLNSDEAMYELGIIYLSGKYIKRDINKAINYLTRSAVYFNNVYSQNRLGIEYETGRNVKQDINKSIYFNELASKQGDIYSQLNIALIYLKGKGNIRKDINKAIYYFELAANQGNSDALYNLGIIYTNAKYECLNISRGIHCFELASEKNHLGAQYQLGYLYEMGKYVSKDINKCFHYYKHCAEKGHSMAQYQLGEIYRNGTDGVAKDISKAIYYYELAAKSNHMLANYMLGCIFYTNESNILQDLNRAIYYFERAADCNDEESQYNLGLIFMDRESKNYDVNKGIYYLNLAAEKGHAKAEAYLGLFYYTKQKFEKALKYFNKASVKNNGASQLILGYIFLNGIYLKNNEVITILELKKKDNKNARKNYYKIIIPADFKKAFEYFKQSANNGIPHSQYIMGFSYLFGIFVPKSITQSIFFLSLSAEKSYNPARFVLGYLYHEGRYVQHDIEKAIHYYKEGSSMNDEYSKNNLGIICKNQKKLGKSITYFTEAIKLKSELALYNLSHIYFFDLNEEIDKAIKLAIKLCSKFHNPTWYIFLCLIYIKKFDFDIVKIQKEINECNDISNFKNELLFYITSKKLYDKNIYNERFEYYRKTEYAYNFYYYSINSSRLYKKTPDKNTPDLQHLNITSEFYEGFGLIL